MLWICILNVLSIVLGIIFFALKKRGLVEITWVDSTKKISASGGLAICVFIAFVFSSLVTVVMFILLIMSPARGPSLVPSWFFRGFFGFGSLQCLYWLFDFVLGNLLEGKKILHKLVAVLVAGGVTLAWLQFPNWLMLDIAAIGICLGILVYWRSLSFKAILVICGVLLIYDLIAVFGTNFMVEAAESTIRKGVPLFLIIPDTMSLMTFSELKTAGVHMAWLGLGDLGVPGLIMMIALRESRQLRMPGLLIATIAGYGIGYLIANEMLEVYQSPQPALIYLIPSTILFLLGYAHLKGVASIVFNSGSQENSLP